MSADGPDHGGAAAMAWTAAVAGTLSQIAPRVARLAAEIADDWPDRHGRAWAERLALVHREVCHQAELAAEFGRSLRAMADDPGPDAPDPVDDLPAMVAGRPAATGAAGRSTVGIRMPGLEATRAEDGYGIRIAQLPDGTGPG